MKVLCIKGKGASWKINTDDIIYIRQEGNEIIIFTEKSQITQKSSIDCLAEKLGSNFFRCHKYCLVNFDKVFGMKDSSIIFDGGQTISMGINYYRNARKAFHNYLENLEKQQ